LDEAQHIIAQEGFAALTMRKLADRIEYSPATIYLHFRSREEIARELAEAGFGKLLAALHAATAETTAQRKLDALGQGYVRFGLENPETYRLIFMGDSAYNAAAFESNDPDSAAAQSWDLLVAVSREVLEASAQTGKRSPEVLAQLLWASLHGAISLQLSCTEFRGAPAGMLAELLGELVMKGLAPGKG
jgi:AcrR family transcriptional regulator